MYKFVKILIRRLVPRQLFFRHEYLFRYFHFIFYIGKNKKCNVCDAKLRKFAYVSGEEMCPRCGSLPRNRRLWDELSKFHLSDNYSVLDFSPSRCLYRVMKKTGTDYKASVLSGDFMADVSYDITKIDSDDQQFDLVVCYHILEHVPDDKSAMQELFRVLKRGGKCLVQTPFKEGDIYEDYSIVTEKGRLEHFGQEDHVRIYSVSGIKERLEKVGFAVHLKELRAGGDSMNGFLKDEVILVCQKP